MNKNTLFTILLLSVAVFIAGTSYGLWYTFKHPAMTNTQVFLKIWYVYLVIVIAGILIVRINKNLWDKK